MSSSAIMAQEKIAGSTDSSFHLSSTNLIPEYVAIELTVGILAVIGNAIVIICWIQVRSIRTPRNVYIMSLAIADGLLGLINVPLSIMVSIGLPNNIRACLLTLSLLEVPLYGSIFSFVAITMDRLWAVAWPYSYHKQMGRRLAYRICCGAWMLSILFAFLPIFGWYNHSGWIKTGRCLVREVHDKYQLIFSHGVKVYLSMFLMVGVYIYLYRKIHEQMKRDTSMIPASQEHRISVCSADESGISCHIIYMKILSDSRHALKTGKIVLVFVICQLPLATIFWIRAFAPPHIVKAIPPSLSCTYAVILLHLNSAINPLLYAFHLSEFRSAMKETISFLFRRCRAKM